MINLEKFSTLLYNFVNFILKDFYIIKKFIYETVVVKYIELLKKWYFLYIGFELPNTQQYY